MTNKYQIKYRYKSEFQNRFLNKKKTIFNIFQKYNIRFIISEIIIIMHT